MNRKFQLILVVFTFLIAYFSLNYYVLSRVIGLFNLDKSILFYIIFAIASLSYIIAMLLEKYVNNYISRLFYLLSSVWMGIATICLGLLLIFEIINILVNMPMLIAGKTIVIATLVLSIYSLINGNRIRIENIEVKLKNLKKEFRAVQLSDIHLGTINHERFLNKVVKKTNKLKPDVVFITGDLVDGSAPITKRMVDPINKINAPIYYIIGNHEIYEGLENIMPILEKTKMNILRNKVAKWKGLQIIGIDYAEEKGHLAQTIMKTKYNRKKPAILLYHSPSVDADFLSKIGIDLHLSGHTHAGQIWPFNYLVRLAFPYIKGIHSSKDGKSNSYVSQGTGTWGPPMRLGSNCEITSITLKKGN